METIDGEIVDGTIDFIERKHRQRRPFFIAVVVSNEIVSNLDWLSTLLAAGGEPGIRRSCSKGTTPAARGSRCTSMATTCCRT
jgi:hypothetical protein